MHSDYVLPAAGWYEKVGIKYTISYVPYLHYCDAAVPPVGESKDEWEIYWLLTKRIEAVSYTHLRAHETVLDLVCRLLLVQKHTRPYTGITHSIPILTTL